MKSICVFCASSPGVRPSYEAAARDVGTLLAARGIRAVYGGGKVGLMGAVADAALGAGGEVVAKEIAHGALTDLLVVETMHERKALMEDLSDGFLTLPGGYGTLEELAEVVSWAQLGIHRKPCGLLDVEGYWEPLITLLDRGVAEGFIRPEFRALVLDERDPTALLDRMAAYEPPPTMRWVDPEDR